MADVTHALLTAANLHSPFHYEQTSDPGAVGANKWWADLTNNIIKQRNSNNTAWNSYGGSQGGAFAGYNFLPVGTTGAEFLAAYNAAVSGDIIVLPNANINIIDASGIWWIKNVSLIGSGPNSKLTWKVAPQLFSSGLAILIGGAGTETHNVTFSGFTIEIDRVTIGPSRFNPLTIGDKVDYISIRNMTILGATGNAIQIKGNGNYIRHTFIGFNTLTEFYEAGIINDCSGTDGLEIVWNTLYTSAGNPDFGAQRPQGIFIANEGAPFGLVKNVHIAHNTIDMTAELDPTTLGICVQSGGQFSQSGPWRYDRITIEDNFVNGSSYAGIRIQALRALGYGTFLPLNYELSEASGTRHESRYDQRNLTDNATVTSTTGHLGTCAVFTRANSEFLSAADHADFEPGDNNFSRHFGFYLTSKPAGDMVILSKWNTTGNQRGYWIGWDQATDRIVFKMSANGTAVTTVSWGSAPSLATWYYGVCGYDAATDTMSISINGATAVTGTLAGGVFNSTADFRIGADHQGNYWDGRIEKVRLFGKGDSGVAPGVYYYNFKETSGDEWTHIYNAGAWRTFQEIQDASDSTYTVIRGNTVKNATTYYIILENDSRDYIEVSDNTMDGVGGGLVVNGSPVITIWHVGKPNRSING